MSPRLVPSTLSMPDVATVWSWLDQVTDPEIPVVNLREMGIIRDVMVSAEVITVVITPTYSGCPAMSQMQADVETVLEEKGFAHQVIVQLSPAWTTDWMSEEAKSKLREYGIAPPGACPNAAVKGLGSESVMRFIKDASRVLPNVACPRCGSLDTVVTSEFGSTACKSLHRCLSCREPFDHFKAI